MTAHAAAPAARRLAALGLWLCLACAGARAAQPDDFIARYAAENDFSGTVLVRADGATRHEASFGRANIAFGVANTPRTKYPVTEIARRTVRAKFKPSDREPHPTP